MMHIKYLPGRITRAGFTAGRLAVDCAYGGATSNPSDAIGCCSCNGCEYGAYAGRGADAIETFCGCGGRNVLPAKLFCSLPLLSSLFLSA